MLLVLSAAALFVALRLRADLDDQVNNNPHALTAAALNAYREGTNLAAVAVEDPEESFVELLDSSGAVVQSAGTVIGPAVLPEQLRQARDGPVLQTKLAIRGHRLTAALTATAADLAFSAVCVPPRTPCPPL
jgi:hypothetical protein